VKYAKSNGTDARGANADLIKYLKHKPDAEAFDTVGNWLWNNLDYKNSEAYYSKAIELKPNFAEAYCHRGNIEQFKSIYGSTRLNEALADYDKAIELKPDLAEAYFGRSSVKQKLGDVVGSQADQEIFTSLKSKTK
jgi:tetratricopeptide (TPR) repeat protein